MDYNTLRHFADSWGLVYLFVIFLAVAVYIFRPGAKKAAIEAAQIPLRDTDERVDSK
ncbi:cbb3-type cytochrome oxidase subunit 3 [Devosia aquimaris]|uniref:cbb3-type cytochrome oxidase subunit 3 n=1 Tax=Devosia aquimaris TaxID=2866214 RepID=UPI001CD0F59C|nr:cbb3-type cytochrome c oxidase subunit 3 [Devosia sp. CJK-A8-3]